MSKKFIPNGDLDFVVKAEAFARVIANNLEKVAVTKEESDAFTVEVAQFRKVLDALRSPGGRTQAATFEKDLKRDVAEQHMRRLGHVLKANKSIDPLTRHLLKLRERTNKPKQLTCPQEPPRLQFVQALHRGDGATPMHELKFGGLDYSETKPEGAVRLELFVDLVPPEEKIPEHPAANHGSRPWYLRSYTKSPIILIPPMARVPMRVVYWARWADSTGNVGPFCRTVVGWIEGGARPGLPGAPRLALGQTRPVPTYELQSALGPATRDRTYVVAVMEAQYQAMHPQVVQVQLPAPEEEEQRRLEGPAEEAA